MLTVFVVLILTAFLVAVYSAVKPEKNTLWIAVIILCIVELIRILPLGRS